MSFPLSSLVKLARSNATLLKKNNKAAIMRRAKALKTKDTHIYTTQLDALGNKVVVIKTKTAVERELKKAADLEFLREAMSMVKDIYVWWKTIKKAGLRVHNYDEYYMCNPDTWDYSPKTMLAEGKIELLRSNWRDTYNDYVDAVKELGDYKKNKK
jgi:hypothetical protein